MSGDTQVTQISAELDAHPAISEDSRRSLGLWLRLMKCTTLLQRGMETRLRQNHRHGLSRFDVFSQLERANTRWLSIGELAGRLLASSGNISRLLDRMEKEGLVSRRRSAEDRRRQEVSLTPSGRELFGQMAEDHADWIQGVLGELSSNQQEEMIEHLDKLRRIIRKADKRKSNERRASAFRQSN